MLEWHDLLLASAAGLLGAPHCIGMCGGTVSAIALQAGRRRLGAAESPASSTNAQPTANEENRPGSPLGRADANMPSDEGTSIHKDNGSRDKANQETGSQGSGTFEPDKPAFDTAVQAANRQSESGLNNDGPSPWGAVMLYNFGRVTTYTFTGIVMGAAGSFLNVAGKLAGMQGAAAMLGGLLIMLWLYRKYTLPLARFGPMRFARVQRSVQKLRTSQQSGHIFSVGVLLGFLPCGLTYAMQMNAATAGSPWAGGALLAVFGLSTMPALLFVGLLAGQLTKSRRGQFRRAAHALTFFIALLAICRGMAANGWIPSVHPWLW